jgi:hypothetical protein
MGWMARGSIPNSVAISLFSTASRPALGPTYTLIQWSRGRFPRGNATGAWSWPLICIQCRVQELSSCISTPPHHYVRVLSDLSAGITLHLLSLKAYMENWFFMTPSIATKFQYVNSLLFSFSLTTWDIQLNIFNWLFLIQRIRCTYAIWCRDVTCCASVLRLCILNTCYQLDVNIKIVNMKSANSS